MTRRRKPGRRKPADPYRARKEARRARGGALLPAREIREALAAGESDGDLAALHGCSISAISRIATGAVQPDAGGPIRTERPRGGEPMIARTVKLTSVQAEAIDAARGPMPFQVYVRQQLLRAIGWAEPGTPGDVSST
jgi:hypothetical protein